MILYCEDSREIGQNVVDYLEFEGLSVDRHQNATDLLDAVTTKRYECIVLDVMLPDGDGFELCKAIRERTASTPIIMTTAKGMLDDKEVAFKNGADDYLVKPFAIKELMMRINVLRKRTASQDLRIYNNLTINTDENRVTLHGEEVHLTRKERTIMIELLGNEGRVVERATLVDALR